MKKSTLILLVGALTWGSGCQDRSSEGSYDTESKTYNWSEEAESTEETAAAEADEGATTPGLPENRKIIKTGDISFETGDLQKTRQRIMRGIVASNSYVSSDIEQNDYYGKTSNTIVIRVPILNFDKLLDSICKGVAIFDNKEVSTQDVTDEYVDAEARINSKKKIEARYLELLAKAKTIEEMLQIERELGNLRIDIESIEGRLQYLKDKVSYSTLRVTFYKSEKVERKEESKIGKAFSNGWRGLMKFLLGLLSIWPLLILGAGVFFGIQKYRKRKK